MNLQKYVAFLRVEEMRSISKAANDMGYSQSAVSKMLAELEKEWEVTLFTRNHDGVELTAEGRALIEDIRRLCAAHDQLNYSVTALHGINKGTIRLGSPISIAANLLPELLKEFRANYPNIKIELYEGEYMEIVDWLKRGVVDVCFLPRPYSERYRSITIMSDELVAILPKDHPLANADFYPVKQFEKDEVINLRELEDYDMMRFFDENRIKPNIAYDVSDDHIMISMVEKGLGVCIEYELLLRPLRYDVVVKPMDEVRYRILELCVKDEEISPLLQLFIDEVKRFTVERK